MESTISFRDCLHMVSSWRWLSWQLAASSYGVNSAKSAYNGNSSNRANGVNQSETGRFWMTHLCCSVCKNFVLFFCVLVILFSSWFKCCCTSWALLLNHSQSEVRFPAVNPNFSSNGKETVFQPQRTYWDRTKLTQHNTVTSAGSLYHYTTAIASGELWLIGTLRSTAGSFQLDRQYCFKFTLQDIKNSF